jgi:ATP-dependent Clp protease ATP-binding subunit ClpA
MSTGKGESFELLTAAREYDDEQLLVEPLLLSDLARFGDSGKQVMAAVCAFATHRLERLPVAELLRYSQPEPPQVEELTLEITAPGRRYPAWTEPVQLRLHVVRWRHHNHACLAQVPVLGITVICENEDELDEQLRKEARLALTRRKALGSLRELVEIGRCRGLTVQTQTIVVQALTEQRRFELGEQEEESQQEPSTLSRVATRLSKLWLEPAFAIDALVSRLADALTATPPPCLLLVGPSGCGKTAAVHELVRRRAEYGLDRRPFWATSGSRLVAGMTGFGMWEERCQKLCREAREQRIILHVGNIVELMEVGKSEHSALGIASFLRPYMLRGDLLVVAECTAEQLTLIESREPHLLDAFQRITVEPPSPEQGRRILQAAAGTVAGRKSQPQSAEVIEAIDRLHRRWATYSAYPGRPLRFLRNLLRDLESDREQALEPGQVLAGFSRETGLPRFLIDDAVHLDLDHSRIFLRERVIGQPEAVELVVNLLAITKTRLARGRKPIASLLFIGPTGVGKTEMAKALAELVFSDRERITRLDMSEYGDPLAAQRLIGGSGYGTAGVLTARVREQPFTVLLLDEIEKADNAVFDLLLQVLGEGRLTDAAGRVADLTTSIVIMTSNLGAEAFQRSDVGFGLGDGAPAAVVNQRFLEEVRSFFRPELFNRFDRVVPFAPLSAETVAEIAHRELELVRSRDGILRRPMTITTGREVAGCLARQGYDIRYGARPLRRQVERELLAPLARALNRYSSDLAVAARIEIADDRLQVTVKARSPSAEAVKERTSAELVNACSELRRRNQRLQSCHEVTRLRAEAFRWQRHQERLSRKRRRRPRTGSPAAEELQELQQASASEALLARIETLTSTIEALEDEVLLAHFRGAQLARDEIRQRLETAGKGFEELLLAVYCRRFERPDRITIAVFGTDRNDMRMLVRAYHELAKGLQAELTMRIFQLPPKGKRTGKDYDAVLVESPYTLLAGDDDLGIGAGFELSAPGIFPRLHGEAGVHRFSDGERSSLCLVEISDASLADYRPPAGIERRGAISDHELRRSYDLARRSLHDPELGSGKNISWLGRRLDTAIASAVEAGLHQALEQVLS